MAMRMDPPDPPTAGSRSWWQRPSGDDESRLLYARVSRRGRRAVVEFYADPGEPARWEQRYISFDVAERVLERGRWQRRPEFDAP